MKDIDDFINTYVGTGRYGQDREDEKDRAISKLTNLLKEAFEAGQKMDRSKYTFADYLKTKL